MFCERGLVGSMVRRGNPYDNAMMEKWDGRLPPQMWKVERAEVDPHEPMASMCPEGKVRGLHRQTGGSGAKRWRAIKLTDFERRQMAALRKELDQEYETQSGLAKQPSKGLTADKLSSSS